MHSSVLQSRRLLCFFPWFRHRSQPNLPAPCMVLCRDFGQLWGCSALGAWSHTSQQPSAAQTQSDRDHTWVPQWAFIPAAYLIPLQKNHPIFSLC